MGASPCGGGGRDGMQLCCHGVLARGFCHGRRAPTGTRLPRLQHLRMRALPTGGRLLIVGDVHGCIAELRALLAKVAFSPVAKGGSDLLVSVGDLVNKGPASGEVVRLARELGALCVRGNHEDSLLKAWHSRDRLAITPGGPDSLVDKRALLEQFTAEDIDWVEEWPLSIHFPSLSVVVVHAGLVPGVPLERQRFRDLLWMRDLRPIASSSNGNAPGIGKWEVLEEKAPDSLSWASQWPGPEHVVFGHDAVRGLQRESYATGLDTACCYGASLTGLLVEGSDWAHRRLVRVQAERMYSKPKRPATMFPVDAAVGLATV